MSLSEDLAWRGLIKDKTFEQNNWLDQHRTFYFGIDASSDSLTIGNLAALMLARRFLDAGWKTILLAGGATSLVGDPKETEERELKSKEEIENNVDAIKIQIQKLFEGKPYELVNNIDWLADQRLLDFLRDTGKYFSMSELMQREFVDARMSEEGKGVSFAEFSYSLLQGYDYLWLNENKGVELQIGASDQWGNMLSGVALIRKKAGKEAHALSMPLVVNKSTGVKFGKSEEGAIWLDGTRTTPYKFYQFWYNTSDADVNDYLKIFSLKNVDKIQGIINEATSTTNDSFIRYRQGELAYELTELVHGTDQAKKQKKISETLSGKGSLSSLDEAEIAILSEELHSIKTAPNGSIVEALVSSELATSNTEARRFIEDNAVYLNNKTNKQNVDRDHFVAEDFYNGRLIMHRGKTLENSALVELE